MKKRTLNVFHILVLLCVVLLPITSHAESAKVVNRDGQYGKYENGVVYDEKTGLEWYAGPDKDTAWEEAKSWVESLSVAGGGWRMPGQSEVESLYQYNGDFGNWIRNKSSKGRNMTGLLEISSWGVWASDTKDSSLAWLFQFDTGTGSWYSRGESFGRGFAVRSKKK